MLKALLSIGHTAIDDFLIVKDPKIFCDIRDHECSVAFEFGAKIPVAKIHNSLGGGACNVAVGASRLGLKSYIYTFIGNDIEGEFSKIDLHKKGVRLDYVYQDDKPTNRSTVISYEIDRTIFSYKEERNFSFHNEFSRFKNIFICSTGKKNTHLYESLSELHQVHNTKIYFNPGTRELNSNRADVIKFLKNVDTLFLNLDELLLLFKIDDFKRTDKNIKEVLTSATDQGLKVAAITDGLNGVYLYNSTTKIFKHFPAFKVKVLEKTGAGDAFCSGYISAVISGKSELIAVEWGMKNSASVIQTIGAQEGLLKLDKIE